MEKIKRILVSQPKPEAGKNPYAELAEKHGLKIDFFKFFKIEGVSSREYRESKIRILDHTAIVFTSKIAIDHFFRICEETRTVVPDTMKYFCTSESIALYLQVYIVYRKRKIFFGQKTIEDLVQIIQSKHSGGKILLCLSDSPQETISAAIEEAGIPFSQMILYHTVSCDFDGQIEVNETSYDVCAIFTPAGVKSIFDNYDGFTQGEMRIAVFGESTKQAAEKLGLRVDIYAPTPEAPSMSMALDHYISEFNKRKR